MKQERCSLCGQITIKDGWALSSTKCSACSRTPLEKEVHAAIEGRDRSVEWMEGAQRIAAEFNIPFLGVYHWPRGGYAYPLSLSGVCVQFKDKVQLEGKLSSWKPEAGYFEINIFSADEPRRIELSEVEAAIHYGVRGLDDKLENVDLLERALKEGWNP